MKPPQLLHVFGTFFLLCSTSSLPCAETAASRLQQALFEEEANRNLPAAVAAYQGILNAHDEERRYAATALFRLGECYRKLAQTNDAVAQYQRLLREFPEQRTLVPLAEQNLTALGSPATAQAASERVTRQASPQERKLIEEQIGIAERQLTEARKRIEVGTQAPGADAPYQRTLIRLQRELAMLDEAPGGPEQRKLLAEEIQVQEKVVQQIRNNISTGRAPPSFELEPQRELLSLKRELVALENATSAGPAKTSASASARESTPSAERSLAGQMEAGELARLQALLRDSPDLINIRTRGSEPPLHKAVTAGQRRVVEFLLNNGADVDICPANADTPLQLAARHGQRGVAELLLDHHASTDLMGATRETALSIAAGNGFKAIAELLLARGASVNATNRAGETALHRAVRQNRRETVDLLLAHHADINALSETGTPLHAAVLEGWPELAKLLLEHGAKPDLALPGSATPLATAAWRPNGLDLKLSDLLLRHGADANARFPAKMARVPSRPGTTLGNEYYLDASEVTPLMYAAVAGSGPVVQRLIEAGAQLDLQDSLGYTALHWATMREAKAAVEILVQRGANLNIQSRDGATPLLLAIRFGGDESSALLFLEHQANPNLATYGNPQIANDNGETPLQRAVNSGSRTLVLALLDHGADLHACNRVGETALSLANRRVTDELASILRGRGASEAAPHPGFISVCRVSKKYAAPLFYQGTNAANRHTLLELFARAFERSGGLPNYASSPLAFPDLENVRINRRADTGKTEEIAVNIVSILESTNCSKDVPLEWGDTVEFSERDHPSNEGWSGFASVDNEPLMACLARTVEFVVKGETNRVRLLPNPLQQSPNVIPAPMLVPPSPPPAAGAFPPRNVRPFQVQASGGPSGTVTKPSTARPINSFWLRDVLIDSNVIRASSDLTRVKVTRFDPTSGTKKEFILDCSAPRGRFTVDLWLQNGDVIELPER